ncbi:MAG: threonine aldolase family protein [Pusillimonas sp.]
MQSTAAPRIDLISDTATRPSPGMRQAMAQAQVGDEQRGEDPSTNELCARVASLLGKEAAVFLPSGVMCNQISILVHCRPGDEIFADMSAHIVGSEAGGPAALAGAMVHTLDGRHGMFTAQQIADRIRPQKRNAPRPRLVVLEQTVNRGGGGIWSLAHIKEIAQLAASHSMAVHMDGARLLNAVVASGVPAQQYAEHCDTVWVDLSKGLGCPVGAVLAGSAELIEQAWLWKHRLGGALRQSGVLAAAGLYALDHHIDRLAQDHANARLFADRVAGVRGFKLDSGPVQTNLVFLDVRDTGYTAQQLCDKLMPQGIRLGAENTYRLRIVTHMDVSTAQVEEAAEALGKAVT